MNRLVKTLLLLFVLALWGAALLATHSLRKPTPPPAENELYAIVNRQLAAFRAADFRSAYRQAAGGVQQKFSLSQFESMIQRDFSLMMRPTRVEFGAVQVAERAALAQVFLTAPDGAVRGFLYRFTAEPDGWKIDAVQSLGAKPVRHLPGLLI